MLRKNTLWGVVVLASALVMSACQGEGTGDDARYLGGDIDAGDAGDVADDTQDDPGDVASDVSDPDDASGDVTPDPDLEVSDASPEPEFEPRFHHDYEGIETGEKPPGGFGRTTVSDAQAYRGERSARVAIEEGDGGGFGKWGLSHPVDPPVLKGGEVWVRVYVWWPESFEFSATPFMKFIRLHNADADGGNHGYNDLYIDNADSTETVLRVIKEMHDVWETYDGPAIPRGRWERYEMYLFVDDVPVDEGGQARFRVWRDDELIFDRTDVPTLETADGSIDHLYIFSYWNNEEPPSNHAFIDDLTLATDASSPPGEDAHGNRWIGDWGG